MESFDRKSHWEKIYQTKNLQEVSWYQSVPKVSLQFLELSGVPLDAKIIDVGGGDSLFVDHLLDLGYQEITVLDISAASLERAKARLGEKAAKIKWIIADIASFEPADKYDFWHDRAAFHFLTGEKEIEHYLNTLQKCIKTGGTLVIGTFSEKGPKMCSGIEIKQYSETSMIILLRHFFKKIKCFTTDHQTPSGNIQNFIFCSFRKLERC